jgi:hypothetical protein
LEKRLESIAGYKKEFRRERGLFNNPFWQEVHISSLNS